MYRKLATYLAIMFIGWMGFFHFDLEATKDKSQIVSFHIDSTYACSTDPKSADYCNQSDLADESKRKFANDNKEVRDAINKAIVGWNFFIGLLTGIVSPAIILAGWLMSPDWTSGDLFGLRGTLHKLWVTVANITYFIYAILLIFIALATIFNSDNYGYKKLLPRLALGIILVPFTWWFIQFIISLSAIVTASAISIPMETLINQNQNGQKVPFIDDDSIPRKIQFNADNLTKDNNVRCPEGGSDNCTSFMKIVKAGGGIYSPLLIYGYGIFKVQELKKLDSWGDMITTPFSILHQIIFGGLMFLIFGLLVLALIAILLMRAIKLWFYAIFSPIMTFKYVLGDGIFGGKDKSDTFSIKEFVGLCFVPAVIGIALSFGLVVLSVLHSSKPTDNGGGPQAKECKEDIIQTPGCEIIGIMGSPNNKIVRIAKKDTQDPNLYKSINEVHVGGLVFIFEGRTAKINDLVGSSQDIKSAISIAGGVFGTVIIDIIALVFIWIAFMAAKSISKVAQAAAEPFEAMGKQIGKLGMSLPKYATILPASMGGSIAGVGKVVDAAAGIPDKKAYEAANNSKLGKLVGMGDQANTTEMKKALDIMNQKDRDFLNKNSDAYKKLGQYITGNAGKNDNTGAMEKLGEELKKMNEQSRIEYLRGWGIEKEQATEIAKGYNYGSPNPKDHPELMKAWKKAQSSGGTNKNSSEGVINMSNYNKDTKSINVTLGDTLFTIKDGKIDTQSLDRIEKEVKGISGTKEDFINEFKKKIFQKSESTIDDATAKNLAETVAGKIKSFQGTTQNNK